MTTGYYINSGQFTDEWLADKRERQEHPELYGLISTGLMTLDDKIDGGMEKAQLVVVGGPAKGGKTTLMMTMLRALARQRLRTVVFSGEMTTIQMGNLLFSSMSRIHRSRIRRIELDERDWRQLEEVGEEIRGFPVYWNYGFSTMKDIKDILWAIEDDTKKPVECVLVDYVQLMTGSNGKSNRNDQLEEIIRELKHLTINGAQPMLVVAAAQVNRSSVRSELYDRSSFLGTGAFERYADIGMIIHEINDPSTKRATPNKRKIEIVVSRETGAGDLTVYYDGSMALIEDEIVTQVNLNRFAQ